MKRRVMLLCGPLLLGAGPLPEGTQASAGIGYSDYQDQRLWNTAQEAIFVGGWRYTGAHHMVFSFAASTAVGRRTYIDNLVSPWRSGFAGTASLRLGYERQYVGLETGLAYWLDPTDKGFMPSVSFWVGHPLLHGWARSNEGLFIGDLERARVGGGLGSRSEDLHVEVGVYSGWEPVRYLGVEVSPREGIWVGFTGRYQPLGDWGRYERRLMLQLRVDPELLATL